MSDNTRPDKKSPPDTYSAFGCYRPTSAVQQLLTLSQHVPDNFIIRQLAKLIRTWVKKRTQSLEPYPPVHDRCCINVQATRARQSAAKIPAD